MSVAREWEGEGESSREREREEDNDTAARCFNTQERTATRKIDGRRWSPPTLGTGLLECGREVALLGAKQRSHSDEVYLQQRGSNAGNKAGVRRNSHTHLANISKTLILKRTRALTVLHCLHTGAGARSAAPDSMNMFASNMFGRYALGLLADADRATAPGCIMLTGGGCGR